MIGAQMKQHTVGMNQLERKHYDQKIARLDEEIEKVAASGRAANMDDLMRSVGLSPRLRERLVDKKAEVVGAFEVGGQQQ